MFGWVDLREDGKKRVENRRENGWEGCSVLVFFFFWIKFCTVDLGSFCLFLLVFFFNILLAFAYFINK